MRSNLKQATGFTLVELVSVMVILGIIGAIAAPKFFDNSIFQSRGFADQVLATFRYAQKSAIAQHRLVCLDLTNTTVTLTIASLSSDTTCNMTMNLADRNGNVLVAPSGVTLSPATTFNFNALGQASSTTEIIVSGVTAHIFVEAETGYVHQ